MSESFFCSSDLHQSGVWCGQKGIFPDVVQDACLADDDNIGIVSYPRHQEVNQVLRVEERTALLSERLSSYHRHNDRGEAATDEVLEGANCGERAEFSSHVSLSLLLDHILNHKGLRAEWSHDCHVVNIKLVFEGEDVVRDLVRLLEVLK